MGNSRAQDAAAQIKSAQGEVERAMRAYSRGGSLDALNRANRDLATAHQELYRVDSGLARDDR